MNECMACFISLFRKAVLLFHLKVLKSFINICQHHQQLLHHRFDIAYLYHSKILHMHLKKLVLESWDSIQKSLVK